MSVTSNCSHQDGELVNPEGSQEGNEYPSSRSPQSAATLHGELWGHSGCENTEHWTQIAEVHIKGMISVSPNSGIFPYIEKHLIA